jgi:glycosyltransferase involved in cell wall biosynthesis
MILTVNSSFPELDHMAAALAEAGMLSVYVRPYANLDRGWERRLGNLPGLGQVYARTFGRRRMPPPLGAAHVHEAGVALDFLMAAQDRLPRFGPAHQRIRQALLHARTRALMKAADRLLADQSAVVASWNCAEPVFGKARASGTLCVLNYPLAHHRFTRRYLEEEAARQPAFAETLNSHDWPEWQERQLDAEIELADHILVGSNFACESFIAEGVPAQKLTVIPYGADTALFEPPEQKVHDRNGLRLLFVGQIGQRKGISYLLEAARRTAAQGDSLTLVGQIQGSGRALVPYRDGFRHVPHVPRVELREIYRQADVFVFPTLVEGMGIVVLEAMASGLPVITTPNGPGDIVRDGVDGFLVPPRDVDAIVERLERLRADPQLRQEMARNARIRAQEFTWDAYRKKTVVALRGWLDGVQAQSPSPQAEVSHVRS